VLQFIRWAVRYFAIDSTDRLSGHTPLHFDLSVCDMFSAFAAGAELHLVPSALNLLPNKLAQFIRDRQLTQWFSVPSVLHLMAKFDLIQRGDFPSLRRVLWCGEVLPTPALMYWMERLPHTAFTNLYGPTETTIASSYYTVPSLPADPHQAIPIGRPCAGETLHVLDEQLRPVEIGEMGHLFIGGGGLSPGYWRDETKTRVAFLPRPEGRLYRTGDLAKVGEDGLIYFLGRADSQIKSRGYRIELGEIETCLHGLGLLQESAIVAVPTDGFEGMAICCAYVPLSGSDSSPAIIRQRLATQLPAYMLPSRWMIFSDLPKNANGKIDRPRLRDMFHVQQSEVVP
jgi:non-ribosomal peptide synthetase component F